MANKQAIEETVTFELFDELIERFTHSNALEFISQDKIKQMIEILQQSQQ